MDLWYVERRATLLPHFMSCAYILQHHRSAHINRRETRLTCPITRMCFGVDTEEFVGQKNPLFDLTASEMLAHTLSSMTMLWLEQVNVSAHVSEEGCH